MSNGTGKIKGTVIDNNNASQADKQINLCPGNSAVIVDTDWSNAAGEYSFCKVVPGDYVVRQQDPKTQQVPSGGLGIHFMAAKGTDIKAGVTSIAAPFVNSVASPISVSKLTIGVNGSGATDPENDPELHPQILTAMAGIKATVFRLWGEGTLNVPPNPKEWVIAQKFHKAGVRVTYEINSANAANGTQQPTVADYTKWLDGVPTPDVTGVYAFEWSNEEDNPGEDWKGTVPQFSTLLQLTFNKLTAKGYKVYCGNPVFSLDYLKSLNAILPLNKCCNGTGIHAYMNTAAGIAGWIKQAYDYLNPLEVPLICTEVGGHKMGDVAAWAGQLKLLYADFVSLGIEMEADIFCLLQSDKSGGAPGGLLDPKTYLPTANYAAIKAGLGL